MVTNILALNGGTIVATDDATAATLTHAALATTVHKVDTEIVLVSNLGQPDLPDDPDPDSPRTTTTISPSNWTTIGFRTGSNPAGYQLTSLVLDVKSPSDTMSVRAYLFEGQDPVHSFYPPYRATEFAGSVSAPGEQVLLIN